jgi:gliding motility-associated-like protein
VIKVSSTYPESLLYRWSTGIAGSSLQNITAGTYTVTATGSYSGCMATSTHTLISSPGISVKAALVKAPFCTDDDPGLASVTAGGGTPPYRFQWSQGGSDTTAAITRGGTLWVTVTDAALCASVDSILVSVLKAEIATEGNYCPEGTSGKISLHASGGMAPYQYFLSTEGVFSEKNTFEGLPNALYSVKVKDAGGCIRSYETAVKLMREDPFRVWLPADTAIGLGQSLDIIPQSNYPIAVADWYGKEIPDHVSAPSLTLQPMKSCAVLLKAADAHGCLAEAAMLVQVQRRKGIYIPNVFMPAGGTDNSHFYISVLEEQYKSVPSFRVFDRWGNQVYADFNHTPNDPAAGWDGIFEGHHAPPGVYAYRIEVEYIDGSQETFTGDVTLVR